MAEAKAGRHLLSCLAALLAGCGGDTPVSLGGGATETDNVVRLHLGTSDGKALPRTQVVFVRTDTWLRDVSHGDGPTTLEAVSDSAGNLRMVLPAGQWSAQAQTSAQGGILALEADSAVRNLVLAPLSTLRLKLTGSPVASLRASGTAWEGLTDSVGNWTFRLPPGARSIVARSGGEIAPGLSVRLPSGGNLDTSAHIQPRRVVLDDFSSGDGRSSLWAYTGMGTWFSDEWGTRIYSDDDSAGPSFRGRLQMRYHAPDTANGAYAGIAFRDPRGMRAMDFRRLDSICFSARGTGQATLFFVEYDRKGTWVRSTDAPVALDTAWRHQCIVPAAMHDPWDAVKTSANTISFLARHGDRLEVRDLVLWGVSLQDLSP